MDNAKSWAATACFSRAVSFSLSPSARSAFPRAFWVLAQSSGTRSRELVNGCLTLAFALGGYFVLKRMLQPLAVLTRYVEQIREGRVEPVPAGYRYRVASELGHLFEALGGFSRSFASGL